MDNINGNIESGKNNPNYIDLTIRKGYHTEVCIGICGDFIGKY